MLDRIGVAVAAASPNVVYMVSETTDYDGKLWRSDNAGESGALSAAIRTSTSARSTIPTSASTRTNPNRVFSLVRLALHVGRRRPELLRRSAATCTAIIRRCGSIRTNSKRILSGSDGGFQVSNDGGENFDVLNNIAFTQFYHINYDMQKPYMLCGGLQDNGTWCGPSNSLLERRHPQERLVHGRRRRRILRRTRT